MWPDSVVEPSFALRVGSVSVLVGQLLQDRTRLHLSILGKFTVKQKEFEGARLAELLELDMDKTCSTYPYRVQLNIVENKATLDLPASLIDRLARVAKGKGKGKG